MLSDHELDQGTKGDILVSGNDELRACDLRLFGDTGWNIVFTGYGC